MVLKCLHAADPYAAPAVGVSFWWKIQGDCGGAWKCLLGDTGLYSSESGEGGVGCGEGWHGVVCLEQLATLSEGTMGAAGVFGEGDGVLGFFKLLSGWGFRALLKAGRCSAASAADNSLAQCPNHQ